MFFNYDTKFPERPKPLLAIASAAGIVVGILFAICAILLISLQAQQTRDHPDGR